MNQEELEKKVRHIQIHSRKLVTELLAGEYRSAFKGMGIEFEGVRQYEHGDDIRSINWSVTARTGKAHVKQFMEERELALYFLVDISGSVNFGSVEQSKKEVSAQIFALLAFAAAHNNDSVGLILFSDKVELSIRPRKGKKHVMYLIYKILEHQSSSQKTSLKSAFEHLNQIRRGRCVAFVLSDFIDDSYQQIMLETARLHDLICLSFNDRRERQLPSSGIIEIVDAESGRFRTVDCGDRNFRDLFCKSGFRER